MKSILKYFVAGLLLSSAFAQAQISRFSVESYSGLGNDVQIPGVTTTSDALLDIQNSYPAVWAPDFVHLPTYFGSYHKIAANDGATVVSHTSSGREELFVTTVSNIYAPDLGFTNTAPMRNVSGRFLVKARDLVDVPSDGTGSGQPTQEYQGGAPGYLTFVVAQGANFTLTLLGESLAPHGITNGLKQPIITVSDAAGHTIRGMSGENGATSLGYLAPGQYQVTIEATDGSNSGVALLSIDLQ